MSGLSSGWIHSKLAFLSQRGTSISYCCSAEIHGTQLCSVSFVAGHSSLLLCCFFGNAILASPDL
jgi:hypothetical protein